MMRCANVLCALLNMAAAGAFGRVLASAEKAEPCLPFYISTFEKGGWSKSFVAFDVAVMCIFVLCMWPAKQLDLLKRVLIAGFGIFMCSGHLLTFLSVHVDLSQIVWSIAIVAGIAAGFFSALPRYKDIFNSITGAYISANVIAAALRSDNTFLYFVTFFVLLAVYVLLSRLSPVYHYAICKSLFAAHILLVTVELNQPFVKPFRSGFYGTWKQFLFHGLVGLVLFFGCAAISFVLTLHYDRVKAKVVEYKDRAVEYKDKAIAARRG